MDQKATSAAANVASWNIYLFILSNSFTFLPVKTRSVKCTESKEKYYRHFT